VRWSGRTARAGADLRAVWQSTVREETVTDDKWKCSEEQAQSALDHHWHTGQPLTTVRAMRAAITAAIGAEVDALESEVIILRDVASDRNRAHERADASDVRAYRQRARTLRVIAIAREWRRRCGAACKWRNIYCEAEKETRAQLNEFRYRAETTERLLRQITTQAEKDMSAATARAEQAERERDEALSLAYVGEHRFPDNTYKEMLSRCAFVMRKTARERDEARSMYCDLFPMHSAAWHSLTSEQRALVESWGADAEKGGGK
jgi:Fe-S-cluster containining protein